MDFARLYKMNTSGKLMQWDIDVRTCPTNTGAWDIITKFGQIDGAIQEARDTITVGKNLGKKNETTAREQAFLEAESKWKKQIDKGYVTDSDRALKGENDVAGYTPMLAHPFDKHGKKIKFPCFIQPKLDGIRCNSILLTERAELFSRKGKKFTACPHIEQQLASLHLDIKLDGELYNHALKEDFEKIVSMVRRDKPSEDIKMVEYHIYDVADEELPFQERLKVLDAVKALLQTGISRENIKFVPTIYVETLEQAEDQIKKWMDEGYEGGMFRNIEGVYEGKRSYNLQKYKVFTEEEFEILGVEEGRGKLKGHCSAFVCKTSAGNEFKAKMEGSLDTLKEYLTNETLWKGKILTVKYQGLTAKNQVPRFPIGKAIRDYE